MSFVARGSMVEVAAVDGAPLVYASDHALCAIEDLRAGDAVVSPTGFVSYVRNVYGLRTGGVAKSCRIAGLLAHPSQLVQVGDYGWHRADELVPVERHACPAWYGVDLDGGLELTVDGVRCAALTNAAIKTLGSEWPEKEEVLRVAEPRWRDVPPMETDGPYRAVSIFLRGPYDSDRLRWRAEEHVGWQLIDACLYGQLAMAG